MGDNPTQSTDEVAANYSIITIGDSAVGKTCITNNFFGVEFNAAHITTIGIDNTSKKITKDGKNYLITVWDTTGQERFAQLAKQYLRKAHGVLFVFSYDIKESIGSIKKWLDILKGANNKNTICLALLGNKADLDESEKVVKKEEGEKLAQELNMPFYDVSAKTGQNVQQSFNDLIDAIITANKGIEEKNGSKIDDNRKKKKKDCC